ncbi:MAG TPA: PQQ-dependent sugar dehydrogenase, partial [Methanomicrobiales archaeon]|nr:PQQ-dependent sugar dehydrogenase [Methanomicrobiales archaeon]
MTNDSLITENVTPGTVTDLTNAGSPYAATFNGGASQTKLEPVPGFTADLNLELVAGNFTAPMMVADPGDGSGRLFVVEQTGLVKIVEPNGTVLDQPFLDLRDRLVTLNPRYDERGLLSLAFHPEYRNNGKVYVFYSAPLREGAPTGWSCTNHLSEFTVSNESPDRVNMTSEKVLMYIDKPYQNHNGGQLVFGPSDGYLYIPFGDGGGANDVGTGHTPGIGNGQDLTKIYGKILRIDVDNTTEGGLADQSPAGQSWTFDRSLYGIPPDNPFTTNRTPILSSYAYDSIPPEIFAYGLRNPAYIAFDSASENALFAADAGQLLFEEVDVILSGGNYGWNIREGTHCFNPNSPGRPP